MQFLITFNVHLRKYLYKTYNYFRRLYLCVKSSWGVHAQPRIEVEAKEREALLMVKMVVLVGHQPKSQASHRQYQQRKPHYVLERSEHGKTAPRSYVVGVTRWAVETIFRWWRNTQPSSEEDDEPVYN